MKGRCDARERAKFGIFDHIEDIPGTPTSRLFKERLEPIKMADEADCAAALRTPRIRGVAVRVHAGGHVGVHAADV